MSGTLYLSDTDFSIIEDKGNLVMYNNIKGLSLILFYSTSCKYCNTILPIFKTLPGTMNGCQFGIINVSTEKKIIEMSKKTNTPLQYVPFILLYFNGKPFMLYNDDHDINKLRKFVVDAAKNLKTSFINTKPTTSSASSSSSSNMGSSQPSSTKKQFAYTTGQPLCGNGVCYLDDEKCYK